MTQFSIGLDPKTAILKGPFDIEVHKANFVNYLEVIILKDGTVEYAVPSHQEKLISIAMCTLGKTRDEINDLCPPEYYCDFMNWLCQITGAVSVWNDFYIGTLNEAQEESLKKLKEAHIYVGAINIEKGERV